MADKIQILFVEDSETDFVLTNELIDKKIADVTWAKTLAAAQTSIENKSFDVILMDLSLPDSHGMATFERICELIPEFPAVVVLTGLDDEEAASESLKRGAQDFLVKGQITEELLMKSLRYAVERNRSDVDARRTNDRLVALNHQLILARDEALETAKLKTEFLADLSHEMRTPLSGIVSLAEILTTETDLSPDVREVSEAIYSSALRAISNLNSLLDLAKLEAGKVVANLEPTQVRMILSDVLATVKPTADRKRLEILANTAPDVPEQIQTDPVRFRQIVLNFAHNAVKFTAKGRVTIDTSVAKKENRPYLVIAVNDTGIGIAESARSRLFEAFVQADSFLSREYGGTGLGLAISKRSVELLSGEIGFDSLGEGCGSTFWFSIPAD